MAKPPPSTRSNAGLSLAQVELFSQRHETTVILSAKVCQQSAALPNEFQQSTAGAVIVRVGAQVLGKLLDSPGENGDLDFRRTGIGIVPGIVRDQFCFVFLCHNHDVCFSFLIVFLSRSPYSQR